MVTIPKARQALLANLEGLVSDESGLRLAELASRVPANEVIIEIGSYRGKSGCYLAEGAKRGKGAKVFCIDAWGLPGNETGRFGFANPLTFEAFQAQVKLAGFESDITPVNDFGADAGRKWVHPPMVGLLFIDGNHTYVDVTADLSAWRPHLAKGSVVVFDDYASPKKCNRGVTVAVDELARRGEWREWELHKPPLAVGFRW